VPNIYKRKLNLFFAPTIPLDPADQLHTTCSSRSPGAMAMVLLLYRSSVHTLEYPATADGPLQQILKKVKKQLISRANRKCSSRLGARWWRIFTRGTDRYPPANGLGARLRNNWSAVFFFPFSPKIRIRIKILRSYWRCSNPLYLSPSHGSILVFYLQR
jgi:hypothetical protein